MKRRIARTLALVLALMLFGVAALAEQKPSEFESTASFVKALDQQELIYTNQGVNSNGDAQRFYIAFDGENMTDIELNCFIAETSAQFFCWNIVKVDNSKLMAAYDTVNTLNSNYRWARFVLDTSDNTIQAEADLAFIHADCFGEGCVNILKRLASIVDDAYLQLQPLEAA